MVNVVCLQRRRHVVDEILGAPSTLNVAPTSATWEGSGCVRRKFVASWLSRDVFGHQQCATYRGIGQISPFLSLFCLYDGFCTDNRVLLFVCASLVVLFISW